MVKVKQVLTPPQQASSYVVNLPQPPVRNAEEYLKAYIGYVYTAVGSIAQEVASIDLHLYSVKYVKGKPITTEIFEHPILSVLHYVNEIETFYNLIEATQTYLELVGEAFWVVLPDNLGPKEIWLLRPDWVKVIPSATNVIDHYNYYAGGVLTEKVEIPKEFVVPFKYFHPMNPYRGKGPVQAAALPFDILNFAQEYNRNFFFNSAIPSMVFSTDQKLSEPTIKRFLNQWQDAFGGRTKANKIAFLGNGMKLDRASFSNKDLDFNDSIKQMRDDVLAVFKVPKTVLGLTEDVNRANADSTTRAFMERVVTPKDRKLVDSINEFYVPMFTKEGEMLFLDFTDPSPEDVELKLKRYQSGRLYTWMTPNEIRAEENLEPLEGGDDLFAPLGSPQGSVVSQSDPNEDNAPKSTDEQDETPNNQDEDKPVEPTGSEEAQPEEEPKGFFGKLFKRQQAKSKKPYVPPAYLKAMKERKRKHMVRVPVKRPEQLKVEQLKQQFVPELRKFIGQLLAQDSYSPLEKKKGKLSPKEQELKDIISEGLRQAQKKTEKNLGKSTWTEEQKSAYWQDFIKKVDLRKGKIETVAKEVFAKQEAQTLANLEDQLKSWRKRLGVKATPATVVPSKEDLKALWTALLDILKTVYQEQGNDTLDMLGGSDFSITTEFATQYLVEYGGQLITQIDDTTRTQLMAELADGFEQGEGVEKLSNRVKSVFQQASDQRAQQIAHSESLRASNAASVEAYRQSGVVSAKEWLAERDEHTCPLCEEEDGKVVSLDDNYFEKGDSVTVGGTNYSFDFTDVGEPPAHVDCRCTTIPVLIDSQGNEE